MFHNLKKLDKLKKIAKRFPIMWNVKRNWKFEIFYFGGGERGDTMEGGGQRKIVKEVTNVFPIRSICKQKERLRTKLQRCDFKSFHQTVISRASTDIKLT